MAQRKEHTLVSKRAGLSTVINTHLQSVCTHTHTTVSRLGVMPNPAALLAMPRMEGSGASDEVEQEATGLATPVASINTPMVVPAPNLPPIFKKMADHIIAGHFVDFAELPPAKGRSKIRPSAEGQVMLVQAAELYQSRRLISDLSTWCQCFAILYMQLW